MSISPQPSWSRASRIGRVGRVGLLLALALTLPAVALAQTEISNGVYTVRIQTSGTSQGTWDARLGPEHEAFDPSAFPPQEILFPSPSLTSFSTLRIYSPTGDEDFPFSTKSGGTGTLDSFIPQHSASPLSPPGRGLRTVWNLGDKGLEVIQDVFIVGATSSNSAIYHTVRVHNVGSDPVEVGWRNLYDWSFGGRSLDRPVNTFENECGVPGEEPVSEREAFAPPGTGLVRLAHPDRDYEILLGLAADPGLAPLPVTPPDKYAYVHWGSPFPGAFQSAFDYDLGRTVSDSAGLSWFGFNRDSARTIVSGGDERFTQVLYAVPQGGCLEPCADIRFERELECARDGSGDLKLDLIVQNLTDDEIHHLFVFDNDPESTVEIVDDYVNFGASVNGPLGGSGPGFRRVPLRIRGATPGETLSLLFTFHNEDLEMCCSRELVIEVPECDCAQVRNLSTCPAFGENRVQSVTFTLDNLSDEEVSHVFITPVAPPTANFTPNHFRSPTDFPAPIQPGGSAGPFAVTADGPDVHPGSEIEFLVSIHDDSLSECCPAQKQRVVLPAMCPAVQCFPVGGATTLFSLGRMFVGNIATGGPFNDGYVCRFNRADAFDAAWLPLDRLGELPTGAGFEVVAEGTADDGGVSELGTLRTVAESGGLIVEADLTPIGSPSQRIEVYRQSELVGVVTGNTEELRVSRREGGLWPVRVGKLGGLGQTTCYVQEWEDLVELSVAGSGPLVGDELRVLSENPVEEPSALTSFTFRAAGIPEVVVTEARPIFDCNANGVPDWRDLASGASSDADGDGVPDECGDGDLEVVLNTGFDQGTGRLIAEGAPDADWQVVDPPPARAAAVVADAVPSWADPLPASRWISVDPNRGISLPGAPDIELERCFCLSASAEAPVLDLRLWADDSASVFLNGSLVGGPGGRFDQPSPLSVTVTDGDLFLAGENCLRVRVEDSGGVVTGLDLAGTVTARRGTCAPGEGAP